MANHGSKYDTGKTKNDTSRPVWHYESKFNKGYKKFFAKRGIDILEEEKKEKRTAILRDNGEDRKSHKKAVEYGQSYRRGKDKKE